VTLIKGYKILLSRKFGNLQPDYERHICSTQKSIFDEYPISISLIQVSSTNPRKTNWKGNLLTLVLLVKLGCFVKKVNNVFNFKKNCFKPVSARRSTVLTEPSPSVRVP